MVAATRAKAILDTNPSEPVVHGQVHYELARATVADDRETAARFARDAARHYDAAPDGAPHRAMLDEWLAEHDLRSAPTGSPSPTP